MTISFRPAKRENVPLLIGVAGGTGSGKTFSALRIATGLANGARFVVLDTENGRARHYADMFDFDVADLKAPFRPTVYADAIGDADKAGYPVIVVDSASHEYTGVGGLLDWHEEDLDRMAGSDWKKREALTFAAWVKPKMAHKLMVSKLLQVRAHVILCFRASEKIEIVKEGGKTVVRPKKSLTGLDGWMPETEKNLPYELTLSFLVTAYQPGVPRPIKMGEQFKPMVPLDQPLTEETGRLLGEWARGGTTKIAGNKGPKAGSDAVSTAGQSEPSPTPAAAPEGANVDAGAPSGSSSDPLIISADQRRRLYTIATNAKVPDDEVKRIMFEIAGVASSKDLRRSEYDLVVATVEKWEPPQSTFADMVPADVKAGAA